MLSLLVTTLMKVWFIACVWLLQVWIIPCPWPFVCCWQLHFQILKYLIYFSTNMFWIFVHFSSNITLVALIRSIDSPIILLPFSVVFAILLWVKEYVFFTHVLPLDFPFHVFGMFECLLIEVGVGEFVGGLIFGDTSSWPDNGMIVLFDNGIIASWQMDNVEVGLMGRVVVALNSMGFCINSM